MLFTSRRSIKKNQKLCNSSYLPSVIFYCEFNQYLENITNKHKQNPCWNPQNIVHLQPGLYILKHENATDTMQNTRQQSLLPTHTFYFRKLMLQANYIFTHPWSKKTWWACVAVSTISWSAPMSVYCMLQSLLATFGISYCCALQVNTFHNLTSILFFIQWS